MSDASKAVIVLDPALAPGVLTNTAAYLALALGQHLPSLLGPDLTDRRGVLHRGTSALALPILRAAPERLAELHSAAHALPDLLTLSFTNAAQTTLTYADYTQRLTTLPPEALIYLGLALYGPKRRINTLTGNLPLLR